MLIRALILASCYPFDVIDRNGSTDRLVNATWENLIERVTRASCRTFDSVE